MNNSINRLNNYKTRIMFVCVVCFLTNLSQMPFLVEQSLTRYISIPIWLLMALIAIRWDHFFSLKKIQGVLLLFVFYVIYYSIAQVFNTNFRLSALPYNVILSLFVFVVGTLVGKFVDSNGIRKLCTAFFLSGMIVCTSVFFTYVFGKSLTGPFYLYSSKNSVSQVLITTWLIILLVKFNEEGLFRKVIYAICFMFLTWTMIALKSRATLIGMPIAFIWILMHGKANKKARNIVIFILVIFVFLMLNDDFSSFFVEEIVYRGKDGGNIEAITSGRSSEWEHFGNDWSQNWLFGCGRAKRESLILTALLEYGILGGVPILILAIYPFVWGMRHINKADTHYLLFTTLGLVYVSNGIFEQLAPFGPGVKCYYLWFLFGMFASKRNKQVEIMRYGD